LSRARLPRSAGPRKKPGTTGNARLYERQEIHLARLQTLTRLNQFIASSLDMNEVLREIARTAATLLEGASAAFALVDEATQTVEIRAWSDESIGRDFPKRTLCFGEGVVGWIAVHRQPVNLPDMSVDDRVFPHDWLSAHGFTSLLGVPVIHDGALLAVLCLNGRRPFVLSAEDQDVLDAFVGQAAVAIRNARLFDETAARQRGAEALVELGRALSETLDPGVVGQRTAESVLALLGGQIAGLYRLEEATGALVSTAVAGVGPAFGRNVVFAPGTGVVGVALRERAPVVTADLLTDPRVTFTPDLRARIERAGYRAVLAVPLFIKDRVIGALSVGDAPGRAFRPEDAQLLQTFAAQAALALENARLFEESAARRREAEALAEVGRAITSSLDPQTILSFIVDRACVLLGTQRSAVGLVDSNQPETIMFVVATLGMSPAFENLQPRHPRDGTTAATITERRPVWSADLLNDPAFDLSPATRALVEGEGYRAVLSVPLTVGDRVLGALVTYRDTVGPFAARQVELLQALADQAAIAIHNSQLYAEAERRRREAEVLAEVARAITASLDLDTVLQRITAGAKDLVGSDVATLWLRESGAAAITLRYPVGSRYQPGRAFSIEPGKGLGGRVLLTGRPIRTLDYAADPAFSKDYVGAVRKDEVIAVLAVPIKSESRVAGVLFVANRSCRPFTDRDEAILMRLADEAAIAIKNAQLFASEREKERRYRSLFENANDPIATFALDGTVTSANPEAERMMGYSAAELSGRHFSEFAHPDSVEQVEDCARLVLSGARVPPAFEAVMIRKDGTQVTVEGRGSAIRDDQGRVVGCQVIYRDMTERKRAEEALRQSEAQLRQSQKMEAVGRLAGGVAHDFNNLLTVITGRTELLLARLPVDDPRRRDLELVKKASARAAALTHQLLAFSRKQMLQPRVLDLNGVVAGMAQMLEPLIGENIDLITMLDPGLGRVKADPGQIEQIIVNLAVNARDAMPQGGRLTIETANVELDEAFVEAHPGSSAGAHAMLCVRDTGTGMTAEIQAHVFEPFFTTKGVGKGTGLGLATVYGIVTQHEGYVRAESAPGVGTAVSIYLRRVPADTEGAASLLSDARMPVASETVLVVEDESELRALATELLDGAGYAVLSAGSPNEALEVVRRHRGPIHLLLTDVVMPEMSGRDLAGRLQPVHPEMRVLYMSGYTDDAIVHHGVLDPGTALLQKPFTTDGLTRMVREVLTR
jgi:PAS domain S-box-containing protein